MNLPSALAKVGRARTIIVYGESSDDGHDVTPFTAEPGQIYYFSAQVLVVSREEVTFALLPLNDDQGKFRLKAYKLSTSKPKSV